MFADDVINEELGGGGEDEPGDPVDDHQHEAGGEELAAGTDHFPDVGPEVP